MVILVVVDLNNATLWLFYCTNPHQNYFNQVIFKMDANGSGFLINLKNLPKLACLRMEGFTEKKFREMCILSGCDYLQSVKGMGLITAHKLLRKHSTVRKVCKTCVPWAFVLRRLC